MAAIKSTKPLTIQSVTSTVAVVSKEGLPNWVLTVKMSKKFTSLPSYFDDVVIPKDTVPSTLNFITCYKNVIAYFKENRQVFHPAKVLESTLFDQSVVFHPTKVVLADKQELSVKCGYLIPSDAKDEIITVASAFVSTAVSYYAKVNETGQLADLPKQEILDNLNWIYPNLGPFRMSVDNVTKSPNISQSEVYSRVKESPMIAIHLMSGILHQAPQFSEPEPSLTEPMKRFYKKEGIDPARQYKVVVPKKMALKTIKKSVDPCGDLWKYLEQSRQIRGEDTAGIGSLSMGYYFFDMPRSLMKEISLIYDFRALMKFYAVKHIFLSASTSEYVKRTLVANDYSVICTDDITYPKYNADKPGIYCSIGPEISALVIKNLVCNRPDVSKGMVNYPTVDFTIIQDSIMVRSGDTNSARYTVTKLPLMPALDKAQVSLFPSCQPHNGYIWVGAHKEAGTYAFGPLCLRSIAANIYRNHYPLNRVAFWSIDTLMPFFHFKESLILPRLSMAKVEKTEKLWNFEDDEAVKFAPDLLRIDVSDYENKYNDPTAFKVGDLLKVLADLRRNVGTDEDFRLFLFAQKDRQDNGNTLNIFLTKLLTNYNWQMIYHHLLNLGDDFDVDYKEYMSGKGKYVPPDPLLVPPVVTAKQEVGDVVEKEEEPFDFSKIRMKGDWE